MLSGLIPLHSTGVTAKRPGNIFLRNTSFDPFTLDRVLRMCAAYFCFEFLFFMICPSCKQFWGMSSD